MKTVNVHFSVRVADQRWSYDKKGEAELDFDIPLEMLNAELNYSDILKGLFYVAVQKFQSEEEE